MKMKNIEIYNNAQALLMAFQDGSQKLPIKINFYLQKNKSKLVEMAQDLEKTRLEIASNYGTLNEETQQYDIPEDKREAAAKELNDLFELEQDVNLNMISASSLSDDLTLTTDQMSALMFMIED